MANAKLSRRDARKSRNGIPHFATTIRHRFGGAFFVQKECRSVAFTGGTVLLRQSDPRRPKAAPDVLLFAARHTKVDKF